MARGNDVQLGGITDLVLLADVKRGFVDALEVATYADRLRRVLRTLNGLRLGSRESSSPASPYTDIVARWRIVHSFRWAIVEGRDGAPDRLLLCVNFDGGWEPYMRVIWDQLGSTLDLMLCHTEGYELSCNVSFETYSRWVRAHETSADFLFIESGRSVGDGEYLALLEASQRGHADKLRAGRLRAPASGERKPLPPLSQPAERFAMAARGLPALAGLFTLQRYFGRHAPDGDCLLRATHDVLFELSELDTLHQFPDDGGRTPGGQLRQRHHEMLAWFEQRLPAPAAKARALALQPGDLQCCLLTKPPCNRGGLVLLRVAQRAQAVAWLGTAPVQRDNEDGAQLAAWRQIALTLAGLKALGVPDARLAHFPQAFKEGMAARAGLLGDVRHNHPTHWTLARHVNGVDRLDPANAHVLVQLRFPAAETGEHFTAADDIRLRELADALTVGTGLALMAIEPMRSNAADQEHFGFRDGISQPALAGTATPGQAWDDTVKTGEVLQGFPTERDKGHAVPEQPDALLDLGSFLVVRKLRQHTGRFSRRIHQQARDIKLDRDLVLAKLMGRWPDGRPLAAPQAPGTSNDFNYARDPDGAACPLHSHIRRANPRDLAGTAFARGRMPRLMRRGMSYGAPVHPGAPDDEDRGLIFMAYNAHIAEQFEVVQRWLSGGNASGGYSGQADPLLAVVDGGPSPRLFPFEHGGTAHAVDLGPEPFVTLQWGAYFFLPSIAALKALPGLVEVPVPAPVPVPQRAPDPADAVAWQLWLEDTTSRDAAWAWVRAQPGGVVDTAYGVLVGAAERVCDVLRNAAGRYSVTGYGERMHESIGVGYLGLDDDTGHREQAPAINAAIEAYGEAECYAAAYQVATAGVAQLKAEARALLAAFPASQTPHGLPTDTPLDFERLSEGVLARLCQLWFGQPDGRHIRGTEFHADVPARGAAARCPRDLFRVSRHVFGPHPSDAVQAEGRAAGRRFTAAVDAWLAEPGAQLPPLAQTIVAAARAQPDAPPDLPARMLAGVMLGFPPTTHANLLTVLAAWVQTRKLWELQPLWHEVAPDAATGQRPYGDAVARLRPALVATLSQRPTPFQVWRKARAAHRLGEVDVDAGRVVIVGIGSATQQDPLRHQVAFGGGRVDPQGPPPHACPGYGMGMGVMLGVIAAVLDAGVLRNTGAPTVVKMGVE